MCSSRAARGAGVQWRDVGAGVQWRDAGAGVQSTLVVKPHKGILLVSLALDHPGFKITHFSSLDDSQICPPSSPHCFSQATKYNIHVSFF